MKIGIIGLGRMGNAIAYRLLNGGHEVYGVDPDVRTAQEAEKMGVTIAHDLKDLSTHVRIFWIMVPHGDPVDAVINELLPHMKAGDIFIDGGNSYYKHSQKRASAVARSGILFLDCGTSGGLNGRAMGFCLMVGGDEAAYLKVHTALAAIAAPGGVAHVGQSGAGHYVKMIHNGIEYGIMQAYAEGFHLIKDGSFAREALDLEELSRIWQTSSVIRSWLLDLTHGIFQKDQEFNDISGEVGASGMGQWTVDEAHEHHIPVPVIEDALRVRRESEKTGGNYATKLVALLRHAFGGHWVKKRKED